MERIIISQFAMGIKLYCIDSWGSDKVPEYLKNGYYIQEMARCRTGGG